MKFFIIKGNSMYPTIKNNDIVYYQSQDSYKVDDIVIAKLDNYFCHRIISISSNNEFYLLRGDNSFKKDGWFKKNCIIGKVIKINHVK